MHRIQNEILLPRQELLVSWFSERLASVSRKGYLPNKEALRTYLGEIVDESMAKNAELRRIRKVPMVGEMVTEALESAVGSHVRCAARAGARGRGRDSGTDERTSDAQTLAG